MSSWILRHKTQCHPDVFVWSLSVALDSSSEVSVSSWFCCLKSRCHRILRLKSLCRPGFLVWSLSVILNSSSEVLKLLLSSLLFAPHALLLVPYFLLSTLYSLLSTLYSVLSTLCSLFLTLYSLLSALLSLLSTLYSPHHSQLQLVLFWFPFDFLTLSIKNVRYG